MAANGRPMARDCPDLLRFDEQGLREFWSAQDPFELKRLGDRLLAESLPTRPPRPGLEPEPGSLPPLREKAGLTLGQLAEKLGVNPELLAAWESGRIRPPESLGLIYAKL